MSQNLYLNKVLHPSKEQALAEWASLVRGNREQAERFREAPERPDFYAPTAHMFKSDPRRKDDTALNMLCSLVKPGDTWLDIGAGAGRNALPLALHAREVIALDPSRAMLENLRQSMSEHNINNIRVIEGRWPVPQPIQADVALISHVGYDIEEIGPFLDAMEQAATRLCVAVLLDGAPTAPAEFAWPLIHGEKRVPLPALREFLVLQIARGRLCEVQLTEMDSQGPQDRGLMPSFLRQQLFIEPGGEKDRKLMQLIEQRTAEQKRQPEVKVKPRRMAIVSWKPS